MKKKIPSVLFVLIIILGQKAITQGVTIGSSSPPNNSAILDLQSNSKGFLPPRMSTPQRIAIVSPAAGLVVFDIDVNQLYLYDGTQWQQLSGSSESNSIYPAQQSPPSDNQIKGGAFGADVAIADNYAVVGAMSADDGPIIKTGAVYVFKRGSAGNWSQVAKLYAPDAQTYALFGTSVAISGNYIVVGSPWFDLSGVGDAGKVYVFVKGIGDTWTLQTTFITPSPPGPAGGDYFGYDVSISTTSLSGPVIIVGSPYFSRAGNSRGQAYSFRFASGSWYFSQTLIPVDLADQDKFGWEVNVDGDYCAIGAPQQDYGLSSNTGAVYLYYYNSGLGLWLQQQKLSLGVPGSECGTSISLNGDMVAIGAPFATSSSDETPKVYIYQRSGIVWNSMQTIFLEHRQGFDASSRFGFSISLDNDKLLVGIPFSSMNHMGAGIGTYGKGYVLVYKKSVDGHFHARTVINDNESVLVSNNKYFGNAVSIKNGYYIIGIPGKAVNEVNFVGSVAFGYIE